MDNRQYVLILGSGSAARELVERSQASGSVHHKLLGCISLNGAHPSELVPGLPFLGTADALREYIFQNPVDVVLISTSLSPALSKELLVPALEIGLTVAVPRSVSVVLEPDLLQTTSTRQEEFLGVETTLLTTVSQGKIYLFCKRMLDIIFSGCALILLAPVFMLVALAIKLSSPKSSVFYRLHWLGKNGRPFVGYKFRTMVSGADKLKQQLLAFNEMQGPVFKMRRDPRVTRFGRFLRKFSLDELPQFYSVLKGDLSLVGPRAPLREEAVRFEFWQRRKLSVKPGMTCLWQVNGRGNICRFDDWVRLDLEYIKRASLLLDAKIILMTIPAVFSGRGAC